jgi:hypothetical protein
MEDHLFVKKAASSERRSFICSNLNANRLSGNPPRPGSGSSSCISGARAKMLLSSHRPETSGSSVMIFAIVYAQNMAMSVSNNPLVLRPLHPGH